jgi:hypothetical protein
VPFLSHSRVSSRVLRGLQDINYNVRNMRVTCSFMLRNVMANHVSKRGAVRGETARKRIIGIDKGPLLIGFRGRHHRHICFLFTPPLCNCRGMIFPAHPLCERVCVCVLFLNGNFRP